MVRCCGTALLIIVLGAGRVVAEDVPETVRFSTRLLTVSPATYERLKEEFRLDEKKPVLANDRSLQEFLEAAQSDRKTNVLQSPRVVATVGEPAMVQIGQRQEFTTGARVAVRNGQVQVEPEVTPLETGLKIVLNPRSRGGDEPRVDFGFQVISTRVGKVERIPVKVERQTQQIEKVPLIENRVERRLTLPLGQTAVLAGWWEEGRAGQEAQRVLICVTVE